MIETLKIRSVTEADKEYSALISLPTPLNSVLIILAPFLLTSKNPESLNECILLFGYMPILCGMIFVFLIYNIILWPFAYIKMFFHKVIMIMVYSKSFRVSRADKFMHFVIWVTFGPFILVLNTITDLYFFVKHLLRRELFKV